LSGLEKNKYSMRLAGERWKSMSDEDKKPFNELAQKDKDRYAKESEQFKLLKEAKKV
jgi:upstream-binding transcription factor